MKTIKSFYLSSRFFLVVVFVILFYVLFYFLPQLLLISKIFLLAFLFLIFADAILLFINKKGMNAYRETPNRLSNGDENEIKIFIENRYSFTINCEIIDEIPFEFQKRDLFFDLSIEPGEEKLFSYNLRPVKRGEYNFGKTNIYAASPIGFVKRRFQFKGEKIVPSSC